MHSEIAAAVSIELGIRGPWHVLSNGCASGLDALGFACLTLNSQQAVRALVISVDLPLVPDLLAAFHASGVLSRNNMNDPYHPDTSGFLPGEAAVALALEQAEPGKGWASVEGYSVTSDAFDAIGIPEDGEGMAQCMQLTMARSDPGPLRAVCPHATGTLSHARAELSALSSTFADREQTPCLLVKPYTGHTLGASGLLDTALLAAFMARGELMPNLPGLTCGRPGLNLPAAPEPLESDARILKLSVGMGGHNAAVILRPVGPGRRDSRPG
jgi:3-oxoacyl-[acyl-carrier-protein] synthase II